MHDLTIYLATKPDSAGFAAILAPESRGRHFTTAGEPINSYENGYSMCQLTKPIPKIEQVWRWKRNIDGGLKLFATKPTAARTYLSQDKPPPPAATRGGRALGRRCLSQLGQQGLGPQCRHAVRQRDWQ